MKYIIRLVVIDRGVIGDVINAGHRTDEEKRVFTVYERVFNGNTVPQIGEIFPIYRLAQRHEPVGTRWHYISGKVAKISHEPRESSDDDTVRTPVVTLENHFNDVGGLDSEEARTAWVDDITEGIVSGENSTAKILIGIKFKRITDPSRFNPTALYGHAESIGGIAP